MHKEAARLMHEGNGLPVLNGVSVQSVELDQEGNLTVTFDVPVKQRSTHYCLSLKGTRTFDVYEDSELEALVKQLFRTIRTRLEARPDPDMAAVDCNRCSGAACCRSYNVLLTEADIARLRGDIPRDVYVARYTTPGVDWSGDYLWQLRCDEDEHGEKCIYLKPDSRKRMRCSVYADRPQICRDFDMAVCDDFEALDGA